MVADCPEIKSKPSTSKKPYKKKALKSTWDSESETDEEVDMTHVCFMANDNTSKKIWHELSVNIHFNFVVDMSIYVRHFMC